MSNTVLANLRTAVCDYHAVQVGQSYKVISEGHDCITISLGGRPQHVPKWVFGAGAAPNERDARLLRRVHRFSEPPEVLAGEGRPTHSPLRRSAG